MPPIKQTFASATRNRLASNPGKPPAFLMPRIASRKDARDRAAESGADFPVGGTKVYLPTFHISMQYNPRLTPNQAQFQVPLYFSKLDLKDLLWHAYRVRISTVRSWVIESKIIHVPRNSKRDLPGKKTQIRPQATKKMIVGLDKPFVWPPAPDFREQELLGKADKKLSEVTQRSQKVMSSAEEREKWQREMRAEKYGALQRKVVELQLGRETWRGNERGSGESVVETERRIADQAMKSMNERGEFGDVTQKGPTKDEKEQVERLDKVEHILEKSATQGEAEKAFESELGTPEQAPTMPPQEVEQTAHQARVMARAAMLAERGIRPQRMSKPKGRKVVEI